MDNVKQRIAVPTYFPDTPEAYSTTVGNRTTSRLSGDRAMVSPFFTKLSTALLTPASSKPSSSMASFAFQSVEWAPWPW